MEDLFVNFKLFYDLEKGLSDRIASGMMLTLLLIAMLMLAYNFEAPAEIVKTDGAFLKMNPSHVTIGQEGQPIPTNQPITISIEVESISDLAIWQVVIYYDNNTLHTQNNWMWLPPDHIFNNKGYTEMPSRTGSDVHGTYIMKGLSLYSSESTFTGSGILCKVNFTAVGTPGTSHLNFTKPIGSLPGFFDTFLLNPDLEDIPVVAIEGTVVLIPEFPSTIILPLLIALLTILAVFEKRKTRKI